MYSYKERIRAVKLYIKNGKRTGPTIRHLGYPIQISLKGWYREYDRNRDLQVVYTRSRVKYTAEQIQVAVQHYLDHNRCIASTLKALGYPCRELPTAWIDELHPEVRRRIVGRVPNVQHSPVIENAAVVEPCTRTTDAQTIAQWVGVCRPTLYNWKNQVLDREASASMKQYKDPEAAPKQNIFTELQQHVALLERDIRRLQLEHDLLRKANELLKKGLDVAPQLLWNREKTLLVDAPKDTYALAELLAELDLARSSYFYHCARRKCPDKYADARIAIAEVFQSNHSFYGYRRMHAALGWHRLHISEKVGTGHTSGRSALHRRTWSTKTSKRIPPKKKWLTDITEFQIPAGNAYLSPMIDCFEGLVVS